MLQHFSSFLVHLSLQTFKKDFWHGRDVQRIWTYQNWIRQGKVG